MLYSCPGTHKHTPSVFPFLLPLPTPPPPSSSSRFLFINTLYNPEIHFSSFTYSIYINCVNSNPQSHITVLTSRACGGSAEPGAIPIQGKKGSPIFAPSVSAYQGHREGSHRYGSKSPKKRLRAKTPTPPPHRLRCPSNLPIQKKAPFYPESF